MQGIADGAADAGAKFDGRAIDLTDVVALNCWAEIETLDGGLDATPTGLEGDRSRPPKKPRAMPPPKAEHCSALRRHRPGHGRRQGRLRPHHHVRPVPGAVLQRLARRQAGEGPPRPHADRTPAASRAAWTTTSTTPASSVCETTIEPDAVRRRRHAAGQPHPQGDAVRRVDRRRGRDPHGRQQRPVHERMAAGRHEDERDRHVRAGHAQHAGCGGVARTSGSAAPRASTGAATTPRTWRSGSETMASVEGPPATDGLAPRRPRQEVARALREAQGEDRRPTPARRRSPRRRSAPGHSLDAKFTTTDLAKQLEDAGRVRPAAWAGPGSRPTRRRPSTPRSSRWCRTTGRSCTPGAPPGESVEGSSTWPAKTEGYALHRRADAGRPAHDQGGLARDAAPEVRRRPVADRGVRRLRADRRLRTTPFGTGMTAAT